MEKRPHHIILKSKNLSIGYASQGQDKIISKDLNFELKSGELIGLVGANGIGKSTLLRTLSKMQPALSGSVYLNDQLLKSLNLKELSQQLSLVLTEPLQTKNLSVFELVALGRHPYTNWIGSLSAHDKTKVEQALESVSILDLKNQKCFELSDGQLQKVMLARALAQDTELIILDEPTTHLDMYHKAYILKLLKDLSTKTGKTILFSSHEIDLAIQLCDTMIVMTEDHVYCDQPCQLIEDGIFESLFPKDLISFDKETGRFKIKK